MLNSPVAESRGLIVNRPATAAGKRPMSEAQKEAREQARKQQRLNGLEALERKVRPAVSWRTISFDIPVWQVLLT